ncbi:hypothetical protein DUI87_21356 [Hirundo rustica rustica]|uniref:Uncharacterized protein n=1 Tax=Hirundo rustica rustica TaxID=333673 RepID=A0A3M0JMU3_HIRRU|nr:hypothetical protein DUI87_21356 [Hirundo rustica rustica]
MECLCSTKRKLWCDVMEFLTPLSWTELKGLQLFTSIDSCSSVPEFGDPFLKSQLRRSHEKDPCAMILLPVYICILNGIQVAHVCSQGYGADLCRITRLSQVMASPPDSRQPQAQAEAGGTTEETEEGQGVTRACAPLNSPVLKQS